MITHSKTKNISKRVKFISYTGDYPNLCSGVLTLEIEGVQYKFGHEYFNRHWHPDIQQWVQEDEDPNNPNYEQFWHSGGHITGGYPDYNFDIHHGEWEIDADELDPKFWDYAAEIDTVFNANVRQGCCGGCT